MRGALPAPRAVLSRPRIMKAALALVDREGLGALSMRTLGAALGVEAMSLYKHVPGKDAILDGIVEAALDEVSWTTDPERSWQARIEQVAAGFRRLGRAHPEVFPLIMSREVSGDAQLRPMEAMLEALAAGGFQRAGAVSVFWTLLSYLYGAVVCELGQHGGAARAVLPRGHLEAAERFPHTRAAAAQLSRCDLDAEFIAGLRRILAGARQSARPKKPRDRRPVGRV